jgi:hypothetical protein
MAQAFLGETYIINLKYLLAFPKQLTSQLAIPTSLSLNILVIPTMKNYTFMNVNAGMDNGTGVCRQINISSYTGRPLPLTYVSYFWSQDIYYFF